jgi:hypothetical protein
MNQGGTAVTLSATPASITQGQTVQVKAVVTAASSGMPEPTGTVTLMEGGATLGSASLASGSATIALSGLKTGTHAVEAVYSGDSNFNANSTATITIPVTAPPPAPSVAITAAPTSLNLTRGQTGTVTFTALANSTFSGGITFAVSGAPTGMTVLLSPSSLTLAAGQSADASLVVSTTAPNSQATLSPMGGAASLAALFLLAVPRRLRRKMSMLAVVIMGVLTLAGVLALTGCGGSSFRTAPKGTTALTVTATPSGLPAQKISVTINVQ